MKLADMTVAQFVAATASEEPAPGGGSVAALEAALGAALTAMVCNFTTGRKKWAEFEEKAKEMEQKALVLKEQAVDIIDRDTEAFNAVSAVFAMPKNTDEEKAARKAAMQEALKGCTKTPLEVMEVTYQTLLIIKEMLGGYNTSAASDFGCAALSLKAGIQGAWLNVLINIGGVNDEAFVSEARGKGEAILDKALPLADEIYEEILKTL